MVLRRSNSSSAAVLRGPAFHLVSKSRLPSSSSCLSARIRIRSQRCHPEPEPEPERNRTTVVRSSTQVSTARLFSNDAYTLHPVTHRPMGAAVPCVSVIKEEQLRVERDRMRVRTEQRMGDRSGRGTNSAKPHTQDNICKAHSAERAAHILVLLVNTSRRHILEKGTPCDSFGRADIVPSGE